MKTLIKIIAGLVIVIVISVILSVTLHKSVVAWRFSNAAKAAGGFPYEIGLTGATVSYCMTSCCSPVCSCCIGMMGGALCSTLDVARCTMYADVFGTPAGGMGSMALFQKTSIGQAGVTAGGQLIAGGMSMTLMDSGVLASSGGCTGSGCAFEPNAVNKIYAWLEKIDKFIIAGFKNK